MSRAWPREFTAAVDGYTVREHIIGRDTPPGLSRPLCAYCGAPVTRDPVRVHHLLFKGRGGVGDPRNGIVVHDPAEPPGCHGTGIHNPAGAMRERFGDPVARGLCRSQYTPGDRDPYDQPVRCAWRGWITLLDEFPWWRPASLAEIEVWYGGGAAVDWVIELLRPPRPDAARRAELLGEFHALCARFDADPAWQERIRRLTAELDAAEGGTP